MPAAAVMELFGHVDVHGEGSATWEDVSNYFIEQGMSGWKSPSKSHRKSHRTDLKHLFSALFLLFFFLFHIVSHRFTSFHIVL